jgi:hypothetical protein
MEAKEWRQSVTGVYSVPVPERFLPLVYEVLAEAYRGEAGTEGIPSVPASSPPAQGGSAAEWTAEDVALAYRDSSPKQRIALDYLADRPGEEVKSRDLAQAVYPDDDGDDAESRIYGVLGAFGSRVKNEYGKDRWFFSAYRERSPQGVLGHMVYCMPPEEASWVRAVNGRPDPE